MLFHENGAALVTWVSEEHVRETSRPALLLGFPERCNNIVVINITSLNSTGLRVAEVFLHKEHIVKKYVAINRKSPKFGF